MGIVYAARDRRLNRLVALKFLPPHLSSEEEAKQRFVQEAQAASALDHPNICTVYEIGETEEGQMYIAMAHYGGETLKARLQAAKSGERPLDQSKTAEIALGMVQGLAAAHKRGIIHRDIKPANVMVTETGLVKVLDFGLAKLSDSLDLTKSGSTLGTAPYMAPEQVRGESLDARTDLWSLGVVMYEMLTGAQPFVGDYEQAIAYGILNEAPEPIQGIDPALTTIVDRLLQKDPADRHQSAEEVVADLKRYTLSGSSATATAQALPNTSPRQTRRIIVAFSAVTLVAIAALAISLLRTGETGRSDPRSSGVTPDRVMVAVLPFKNLGPAEDEYFAAGITEEIISRLAKIEGLGVISRTSAFKYQETDKSIGEIASELGVEYVLEGSVRWSRGENVSKVRITPTFIQAVDDTPLWSDTYDESLDDIFSVQSSIAQRVVGQLELAARPETFEMEAPTANLEAYQFYLKGLEYSAYLGSADVEFRARTVDAFEQTVRLDPFFAEAWAQLSIAHAEMVHFRDDPSSERAALSRQAVDRALELHPDLPEALKAEGNYYYQVEKNFDQALRSYAAAAGGLPNSADIPYAMALVHRRQSRFEEAIVELELARKLDPRQPLIAMVLGVTLSYLGRCEDARQAFEYQKSISEDPIGARSELVSLDYQCHGKAAAWVDFVFENISREEDIAGLRAYSALISGFPERALEEFELSPHQEAVGQWYLLPKTTGKAWVYEATGRRDLAKTHFREALSILETNYGTESTDPRVLTSFAFAYAGLGDAARAITFVDTAFDLLPEDDFLTYKQFLFAKVLVYNSLRDKEQLILLVDELLTRPSSWSVTRFQISPEFDWIRGDPEFDALIVKHQVVD
jgi:serine/threonine protein kinase/Flp pilus assembly protein TadD